MNDLTLNHRQDFQNYFFRENRPAYFFKEKIQGGWQNIKGKVNAKTEELGVWEKTKAVATWPFRTAYKAAILPFKPIGWTAKKGYDVAKTGYGWTADKAGKGLGWGKEVAGGAKNMAIDANWELIKGPGKFIWYNTVEQTRTILSGTLATLKGTAVGGLETASCTWQAGKEAFKTPLGIVWQPAKEAVTGIRNTIGNLIRLHPFEAIKSLSTGFWKTAVAPFRRAYTGILNTGSNLYNAGTALPRHIYSPIKETSSGMAKNVYRSVMAYPKQTKAGFSTFGAGLARVTHAHRTGPANYTTDKARKQMAIEAEQKKAEQAASEKAQKQTLTSMRQRPRNAEEPPHENEED